MINTFVIFSLICGNTDAHSVLERQSKKYSFRGSSPSRKKRCSSFSSPLFHLHIISINLEQQESQKNYRRK
ncbi:hypothetical protein MTR_8g095675 [Medicago truncatula]|uniref:Transmembrane protein n=1 Tax=Medicago truncatula TaxID=3880 RepID=A0A072TTW6_MEDTR|nr:hypothetical protein MTR_8g095675 [Medicago truncatula]